jgi:hypothetical protein
MSNSGFKALSIAQMTSSGDNLHVVAEALDFKKLITTTESWSVKDDQEMINCLLKTMPSSW